MRMPRASAAGCGRTVWTPWFPTDGDGDRPLIADKAGTILRGDAIGALTARLLGADAVATPVTSSTRWSIGLVAEVVRTRVGSPFVVAGMHELGARGARLTVGYEANGGFLTAAGRSARTVVG